MRRASPPIPRFVIRPIDARDYPALTNLLGDPETMGAHWDVMDALDVRLWIAASRSLHHEYALGEFAIIERATNRLVGDIGVGPNGNDPTGRSYNISWVVHRAYQGRGIATEAAAVVMRHAFNSGVIALHASMAVEHIASRRVATKLGMRFVRVHRHPDDFHRRHTLYEMHLVDWLARTTAVRPERPVQGS